MDLCVAKSHVPSRICELTHPSACFPCKYARLVASKGSAQLRIVSCGSCGPELGAAPKDLPQALSRKGAQPCTARCVKDGTGCGSWAARRRVYSLRGSWTWLRWRQGLEATSDRYGPCERFTLEGYLSMAAVPSRLPQRTLCTTSAPAFGEVAGLPDPDVGQSDALMRMTRRGDAGCKRLAEITPRQTRPGRSSACDDNHIPLRQ